MAVKSYKCPNCGGGLAFNPETQKLKCEYCEGEFLPEELERRDAAAQPPQAEQAQAAQPPPSGQDDMEHAVVYSCPSCGAEIVTDDTTAATFCYYCHNPVVLAGRLDGAFRPDRVIPFTLDREQAVENFLAWVKKKKFVPREFFSKEQIEKVSGVYFPYWMAECDLQGNMDAQASRVRVWRVGDLEYTETSRYQLSRGGNFHFSNMLNPALKKANRVLVESVQPFDFSKLKPFSMTYLSGFQAEKRDIEKQELLGPVQQAAGSYASQLLRDTMGGYVAVFPGELQLSALDSAWNYALLPVWVLTYPKPGGKLYYYAMNGQTGNVCGELPVSRGRLAALFTAVAVGVFLICVLLGRYLL